MLEKSLASPADSIAYDLEDAVAPSAKPEARRLVAELLDSDRRPKGELVARINAVGTGFEAEDLDTILRARHVQAIALPKTNEPDHVEWVVSRIKALCPDDKQAGRENAIRIIGMIESAEAMVRIADIAASGRGHLDALLFAAEDCELCPTAEQWLGLLRRRHRGRWNDLSVGLRYIGGALEWLVPSYAARVPRPLVLSAARQRDVFSLPTRVHADPRLC